MMSWGRPRHLRAIQIDIDILAKIEDDSKRRLYQNAEIRYQSYGKAK